MKRMVMMSLVGVAMSCAIVQAGLVPGGDFSGAGLPGDYPGQGSWAYDLVGAWDGTAAAGLYGDGDARRLWIYSGWMGRSTAAHFTYLTATSTSQLRTFSADIAGSYFGNHVMGLGTGSGDNPGTDVMLIDFHSNSDGTGTASWSLAGGASGVANTPTNLGDPGPGNMAVTFQKLMVTYNPVAGTLSATIGSSTIFANQTLGSADITRIYFKRYCAAGTGGQETGEFHIDNVTFITTNDPVTVTGTVSLNNYAGDGAPNGTVPIAVRVELRGPTALTVNKMVNSNGDTFSIDNVIPGNYTVAVKAYAHLQKVQAAAIVFEGNTSLGNFNLVSGDIDGSNAVDSSDLAVVLSGLDTVGNP